MDENGITCPKKLLLRKLTAVTLEASEGNAIAQAVSRRLPHYGSLAQFFS
jgi:hypothetical protein